MNRVHIIALALLMVGFGASARAAVSADDAIAAVTVYPDRAAVTRRIQVDLVAGINKIVLDDLPAALLRESVRVDGSAASAVRLGAVEIHDRFSAQGGVDAERRLKDEIEALQDRRRALDDEIRSAQAQLDFIAGFGHVGPTLGVQDLAQGVLDPKSWEQSWTAVSTGTADALRRIREAQLAQRSIDRELAAKQQEQALLGSGGSGSVEISIELEASAPGRAVLALSYQVPNASWRPLYEARLNTETGEVNLTTIAEVQQHTGEDWSQVTLTLSTTRPALGAVVPELETWFIGPAEVANNRLEDAAKVSELDALQKKKDEARGAPQALPSTPASQPINPGAALLIGSEFAAEYRVPGDVNVPADGSAHRFTVSDRRMKSTLSVVSTPRYAPVGYLIATATHVAEEPLLPGPVSVFRDGSYVGLSQIGVTPPGSELKLSFGADDKVKIDYRLVSNGQSEQGLISTARRIERQYRIAVANHHDRPIEITVLDQIPVSQDERISVELLKAGLKPTESDFDGRKGVLAWKFLYKPGEERVIDFRYAVTAPADVPVVGL